MRGTASRLLLAAAVFCTLLSGSDDRIGDAPLPAEKIPSDYCLKCHTSSIAPYIDPNVSHCFAVDYATAAWRKELALRRVTDASGYGSTVEQDMLVDGKVECTSCHVSHDQFSDQPHRLRNNPTQNELCRACHRIGEGR